MKPVVDLLKTTSAVALAATLYCANASAAKLYVFGDTDMFNGSPLNSDKGILASNMLDGGSRILISDQTTSGFGGFDDASGLRDYYAGLGGVTTTTTSIELTSGFLSGTDLLVLDVGYQQSSPYSAWEISAIQSFLSGTGDVVLIAEPDEDSPALLTSINRLLAGIGSSISLGDLCCFSLHDADTILTTPLTDGVSAFSLGKAHALSGGTAAIQDQEYTVVAFESVQAVPIPPAAFLFGTALGIFGYIGRRNAS